MREASRTAQRVAAYRLDFQRAAAEFGDPGSDGRLATDVAHSLTHEPTEQWARYLQGRTTFFDRVVVNALERDVTQVLTVGAGYDGRSLRYAKPGVQWFEADHPATQDDKRERLQRLGIDASHVAFVSLNLVDGGLAARLLERGWEADAVSVMLCEGLAVYLDIQVLETLLRDLRTLGTVGTRLAVSISPPGSGRDQRERRERLEAEVAALGEPARSHLHAPEAEALLARAMAVHRAVGPRRASRLRHRRSEYVPGKTAVWKQATFRQLGELLGRLHTRPVSAGADGVGAGGAWHHLVSPGGPSDEVAAAGALLKDSGPRAPGWQRTMYDELRDAVARAEDCHGLPDALIHPDFVPVNGIASGSGQLVIVDWAGAGVGPRLWSLAFLLWAAGAHEPACIDAVMSGYRGHVELDPSERDRLPAAIAARPVRFNSWSFCTGRAKLSEVSGKLPEIAAQASTIARRALTALDKSS